jgi:hypothetical protein
MTRHPFRWENLIAGAVFLTIAATWAVWEQDLLTPRELGITASTVLIVLGVTGVAATLWRSRPAPSPHTVSTPTTEHPRQNQGALREPEHQEADPQS